MLSREAGNSLPWEQQPPSVPSTPAKLCTELRPEGPPLTASWVFLGRSLCPSCSHIPGRLQGWALEETNGHDQCRGLLVQVLEPLERMARRQRDHVRPDWEETVQGEAVAAQCQSIPCGVSPRSRGSVPGCRPRAEAATPAHRSLSWRCGGS